jgi:hypothetical protein
VPVGTTGGQRGAGGEALGADAVGGHAGLHQRLLGGVIMASGPQMKTSSMRHRQQGLDDLAHLVAVDAAWSRSTSWAWRDSTWISVRRSR